VEVRVCELRHRLDAAQKLKPKNWRDQTEKSRDAAATAAGDSLNAAHAAATEVPQFRSRLSIWWTGTALTAGWESVHEAELNVMQLESAEEVWTNLSRLLSWIQQAMDSGDLRDRHEGILKAQLDAGQADKEKRKEVDRTAVRQAFKDVVTANRERYANLRAFRNTLVTVTGVLAALIVLLAVWHAINPAFLSFCACATEYKCTGSGPGGADVALVALVGAVGGSLAIVFGLAEADTPPSRYDPKVWQALLKPVAGAATGLAGVILIQAEILIGVAGSCSESMLLGYAVLFGFSQQLFTHFVDKRAENLIGTDSKDSKGTTKK
jgi:uncharacterized protein YbdZ (MbtH family)